MKIPFLLLTAFILMSCHEKHHTARVREVKIKRYHVCHHDETSGSDAWLWYYIMMSNNGSTYYYYSSPTPVTSYSSVTWISSNVSPFQSTDKVEEEPEIEVPENEANITEEMEPEMTQGEIEAQGTESESASPAEGTSAGEGESGGSDAGGGGDSGGSDGGGGSSD